jgi:hypothetical protein
MAREALFNWYGPDHYDHYYIDQYYRSVDLDFFLRYYIA